MDEIDRNVMAVTSVGALVDGQIFTEEMNDPTKAIVSAHEPVVHKRSSKGAQA